MDCELEQRDDGLWHCKAECGREPYPKKIKQRCGHQPEPQRPPKHTCGADLVRKKRSPEDLWWWRCEACREWDSECKRCNAKSAADRPKLESPA